MNQRQILEYYSREDIQSELLRLAKNREVVGVYGTGSYGQRPNSLVYQKDIIAMARSGIVEFHSSLERWKNPLYTGKDRMGFDIIMDIDCNDIEHGKIAAKMILEELARHDLTSASLKFSGGTGFHIGIPWESLPREIDYKPTRRLYPELPRIIVSYLKHKISERLEKELLTKFGIENLSAQTGQPAKDFLTETGINPYKIVNIDPILISPRHLVRMAYSLNCKRFLVSLPIKISNLDDFRPEMATPATVNVKEKFLFKHEENEAEMLIAESIDWNAHISKEKKETIKRKVPATAIKIEHSPPCIKNILNGLTDGKKRSVFILLNYLSSTGWKTDNIEKLLFEWNSKNKPPLPDNYITSQLRYHKKIVPPPNCEREGYYMSFGVCKPDNICGWEKKTIKNPINYPLKKLRRRHKPNQRFGKE